MYEVMKEYVGRVVSGVGAAVLVLLSSSCADSASKQMYVKPATAVEQKKEQAEDENGTSFPGVRLNKSVDFGNLGSRVAALANNR